MRSVRGGGRHGGQGRYRGQLVAEVVGHEQGGVTEVLGPSRLFGPGPRRPLGRRAELGGESELVFVRHAPHRAPCPCESQSGVGTSLSTK